MKKGITLESIKSFDSEEKKTLYKPKLEDFYDTSDPRGCSTSEYEEYQNALLKWEEQNKIIKS